MADIWIHITIYIRFFCKIYNDNDEEKGATVFKLVQLLFFSVSSFSFCGVQPYEVRPTGQDRDETGEISLLMSD